MTLIVVVESLSHAWLLYDPMDCIPPGSSVHGIFQARILEWVAMPFSRTLIILCKYWLVNCITQSWLFFFFLTLQYGIGFAISTWIRHRYTRVPHPEPSSLLPPQSIPLGHPSAPAPSIQYRASNLDWQLISCMIFYMFQCHSPKSSHPFPLSQSP